MRSSSSRMNRENSSPWVWKCRTVTDASPRLVWRAWSTSSRPATSSSARIADLLLISKSRARPYADPPPGVGDAHVAAPVKRASLRARLVAAPPPCSASSTLACSKLIMACSSPLLPGHREGAPLSRSTGLATKPKLSANGSHPSRHPPPPSSRQREQTAPSPPLPLCTSSPATRGPPTHTNSPTPLTPPPPSAPLATPGAGLRVGGTGA